MFFIIIIIIAVNMNFLFNVYVVLSQFPALKLCIDTQQRLCG